MIIVIAHFVIARSTYNSITLINIVGICFWTTCLCDINLTLSNCHITICCNQRFSTIDIDIHPLVINNIKSFMNDVSQYDWTCKGFDSKNLVLVVKSIILTFFFLFWWPLSILEHVFKLWNKKEGMGTSWWD